MDFPDWLTPLLVGAVAGGLVTTLGTLIITSIRHRHADRVWVRAERLKAYVEYETAFAGLSPEGLPHDLDPKEFSEKFEALESLHLPKLRLLGPEEVYLAALNRTYYMLNLQVAFTLERRSHAGVSDYLKAKKKLDESQLQLDIAMQRALKIDRVWGSFRYESRLYQRERAIEKAKETRELSGA